MFVQATIKQKITFSSQDDAFSMPVLVVVGARRLTRDMGGSLPSEHK